MDRDPLQRPASLRHCPSSQRSSSSKCRGYLVLFTLLAALSVALAGPWVYSDNEEPAEGTIRVTTIGSGTPDVRRHQVDILPLCLCFQRNLPSVLAPEAVSK
jgi:hypothetical protein